MSEEKPSPGWYPDPLDATGKRYWDGSNWTEETRLSDAPESSAAPPPTPPETASPRRARRVGAAAVAILVLGVLGGTAWFLLSGNDDGDSGRLLVQDRPDRSGAVHLVSPGDEFRADNEILREAQWVNSPVPHRLSTDAPVPTDITFLEYSEEGTSNSDFGFVADGGFVELIRLREENVDVRVTDDGGYVISTWSYTDSGGSCHVGADLRDLAEIRTPGGCLVSADGSLFVTAEWDDDVYRYEVVDRDGNELLSGESADYPTMSENGQILATVRAGTMEELEMWALPTGEQLAADTRADDISISGFVDDRAIVHAWDESSGRSDISMVGRDGTETELARASTRHSQVVPDAGVVVVSDDGETTFYSARSGEELGSVDADWVEVASSGDGRWIAFAISENRAEVYWASGETEPAEIASHRISNPYPTWVNFTAGTSGAYTIEGWDDGGSEGVIARVNGTSAAEILAEDVTVSPAWTSSDASTVLAVNFDNGAELMLLRAGERPEVLDDEDSIYEVRVREGVAYYTAVRNDDLEIRSVRLAEDARPTTLFEDARLVTIENAETNGAMVWLQGE